MSYKRTSTSVYTSVRRIYKCFTLYKIVYILISWIY